MLILVCSQETDMLMAYQRARVAEVAAMQGEDRLGGIADRGVPFDISVKEEFLNPQVVPRKAL